MEEVGGAVQRDHGLAGARATIDHERAARPGADHRVLVGLDGAQHVPHSGRAAAAEAGDEGGLVVERGVPFERVIATAADTSKVPNASATTRDCDCIAMGHACSMPAL